MANHKLEVEDGNLFITLGGERQMVMFFFGGDDIRVPSWPDCDFGELYSVLYAIYQCEEGFKDRDTVELPDGRYFGYCDGIHFIAADEFVQIIDATPIRSHADY